MTHDEITGNAILSKAELKDGCYYIGRCRNASVVMLVFIFYVSLKENWMDR